MQNINQLDFIIIVVSLYSMYYVGLSYDVTYVGTGSDLVGHSRFWTETARILTFLDPLVLLKLKKTDLNMQK